MLKICTFKSENFIWQRLVTSNHRHFVNLSVVVGCYRVLSNSGFRVLVTSWSIRLEKGVDCGIARLVHVEAVFVLEPHHESRCDAFHIYLRSVENQKPWRHFAKEQREILLLLKNMLITVSIFMFHSRYDEKFAFIRTVFNSRYTLQRSVLILWQEHNKTQWMIWIRKQTINML